MEPVHSYIVSGFDSSEDTIQADNYIARDNGWVDFYITTEVVATYSPGAIRSIILDGEEE